MLFRSKHGIKGEDGSMDPDVRFLGNAAVSSCRCSRQGRSFHWRCFEDAAHWSRRAGDHLPARRRSNSEELTFGRSINSVLVYLRSAAQGWQNWPNALLETARLNISLSSVKINKKTAASGNELDVISGLVPRQHGQASGRGRDHCAGRRIGLAGCKGSRHSGPLQCPRPGAGVPNFQCHQTTGCEA